MFSFVPECLSPLCQNQVFGLVWRILLHKMDDPSQHRNRIKSNIMNIDSFFWQNYTIVQGVFFNWYPPKKLKYGKPRLGVSTLT